MSDGNGNGQVGGNGNGANGKRKRGQRGPDKKPRKKRAKKNQWYQTTPTTGSFEKDVLPIGASSVDAPDYIQEIPHAKKRAFLQAFRVSGSITVSVRAADISSRSHYNWLRDDEQYEMAFRLAERDFCDLWEAEGARRALKGTRELVLYKGKPVKVFNPKTDREEPLYRTTHHDTLWIVGAKARMPERYRDRYDFALGGGGGDGSPIPVTFQEITARDVRTVENTVNRLPSESGEDGS